jgi:hypothetical protein
MAAPSAVTGAVLFGERDSSRGQRLIPGPDGGTRFIHKIMPHAINYSGPAWTAVSSAPAPAALTGYVGPVGSVADGPTSSRIRQVGGPRGVALPIGLATGNAFLVGRAAC